MASEYDICVRLDKINKTLLSLVELLRELSSPPRAFEDNINERLAIFDDDDPLADLDDKSKLNS